MTGMDRCRRLASRLADASACGARPRPDRARPPRNSRVYAGLHEAAAKGDVAEIEKLIKDGERINLQDSRSRTPLHVAAYMKKHDAARALLKLGANPNALEIDRYDIVTIASVANDIEMLKLALEGGASARNVTSRYDGTALIAAAHLGHAEVVQHPDRRQGAAQPRQQSRLDRADGVDRARQRRQEPHRHAEGAGRRRRRRQHRRPPGHHAAAARAPPRLCRDGAHSGSRRRAIARPISIRPSVRTVKPLPKPNFRQYAVAS